MALWCAHMLSCVQLFVTLCSPPAEKAMAPHSSVLAWRIPGTGEPGGLRSMGSHRVRHDWTDLAAAAHQASLSIGFFTKEYWKGLPFPFPGDLPDSGTAPISCVSCIAGRFFTTESPGKPNLN